MCLSNQQLCSKVSSHEIFPECDPTACLWITAIPFTTAWVWLGQGGGGTKNTQKIPNTRGLCCVCVCLESHRALSPTGWFSILLESKLWEAGLSQVSRSVTSLHGSFLILGRKKRHPRDSEGTLQYPVEKGILQPLGFPLLVFFRLWGVSKIPFSLHPLPVVLNIIPVGNRGVFW